VQVIERDQDRLARCQAGEQLADCAVNPDPVFGGGGGGVAGGEGPHRREGGGELVDLLLVEGAEGRARGGLEEAVERIDEEAEGHLPLELRGAPVQDDAAAARGTLGQLPQQPRLPHPGIALDRGEPRGATLGLFQPSGEELQLALPADQAGRHLSHFLSSPP
jgi:hypothetical protein